jgi:hypothetical protein
MAGSYNDHERVTYSRRAFLRACSLLALGAVGCSTVVPGIRFGRLFIPDPHPDDYMPVLLAAIGAILPFDDPRFPNISPQNIADELVELFPLQEQKYNVLDRSILYFNAITLFPYVPEPLIDEERNALAMSGAQKLSIEATIDADRRHETEIYDRFAVTLTTETKFLDLSLDTQRAYIHLWKQSGFFVKRQFHDALKSLVMITAYSRDDVWKVINYEGPILTLQ